MRRSKLKAFTNLLKQDRSLEKTWLRLREEVLFLANTDRYPLRHRYTHMDHGPAHWENVRRTAAFVWFWVATTKPETIKLGWWTAEAAFILSVSCYLHDVAMVYGCQHVPVKNEDDICGDHVWQMITEAMTKERGMPASCDVRLLPHDIVNMPVGQVVIRQLQGFIAEKVAEELAGPGRPLAGVSRNILKSIRFLVRHYGAHDYSDLVEEAKMISERNWQRLMAMAAVLQFSDWVHCDASRVDRRLIQGLCGHLEDYQANPLARMWVPMDDDGSPLCALPTLFRNHYVVKRRLGAGQDSLDRPPILELAFTIVRPQEIRGGVNDPVWKQVRKELQDHLYPVDFFDARNLKSKLRKFAGIELRYEPPGPPPRQRVPNCVPVPDFVQDFWRAGDFFNLDNPAQLMLSMNEHQCPSEFCLRSKFQPSMLKQRFHVRGIRQGERIGMPRRLFVYLHFMLTRGHPRLAALYFEQLCSELHREVQKQDDVEVNVGLAVHDAYIALRNRLKKSWHDSSSSGTSESQQKKKAAFMQYVGQVLWPRPVEKDNLPVALREAINKSVSVPTVLTEGVGKKFIRSVLDQCVSSEAIVQDRGLIMLSPISDCGAFLALLGAQYKGMSQAQG